MEHDIRVTQGIDPIFEEPPLAASGQMYGKVRFQAVHIHCQHALGARLTAGPASRHLPLTLTDKALTARAKISEVQKETYLLPSCLSTAQFWLASLES